MNKAADSFDPLGGGASYGLGNKLERLAWNLAWLILFRFTPPMLHGWRRGVLRAFGAQVGAGARIYGSVRIWLPRRLSIGRNALIGPGARLYNQGRITIGDRCVISQRAHLCASTHSLSDPHFRLLERPITLGQACWVAAEAFVGPGASMGDGAVLGARGVLFEQAGPLEIWRGNPARQHGQRHLASPQSDQGEPSSSR